MDVVFESSDLEIIESFDFEEEVQRPEELRFFTLEEQLTDYFQKVLPKRNHVTKAEHYKIKNEVDRIRKIYEDLVVLTDTDYRIDTERREINVPWLMSIYGGFDFEKYSYAERILPLHEPTARRTPNAYPVLLAALPRPYRSEGSDGVPVTKRTELVNEEGLETIRALGNYVKTKRVLRDDGSVEVHDVPVANTGDDIRRVGFFIGERLSIPHPLGGHPFLSSGSANKIMTSEPLKEVFPTIEAIMSHAVPVTTDPYVEGHKYLKVYDVRISEIPWKSWKDRFPPADTIQSQPPVLSVVFPSSDEVAPSDKLEKIYASKWPKAVYPRMWLMEQEDAGKLVTKMLLSDAGDFGLIAPDLMNERPTIQLPESTPAECLQTGSFEEFLASGVYRPPGVCAPTAFVTQERQESISKGKKAWTETARTNIQKEYIALLKFYQMPKETTSTADYEKFKMQATSELRDNIIIILKDTTLLPPDKSYNIRLLIKEITPVNNVFLDKDDILLICGHTLSELDGEMADRFEFYNKWTTLYEGSRICKSCGEEINSDNYIAQEEYDDDGHLVVSHDVLADGHSEHPTFASSLTQLKNVFSLDNAGEAVLYLLLNRLQVLPNESQIIPILGYIRKGSLTAKRLPGTERNRFEGLLGIAAMVTILQIHNPFLIPRRSFGNKVVRLSGFPRDTLDDTDTPVLNLILSDLKDILESFPTSFKEPLATILREVSRNRKKVREDCIKFIKNAYTQFKPQFDSAKERALTVSETVDVNRITLPLIIPPKAEFSPGERHADEKFAECSGTKPRSTLMAKMAPSVSQKFPELWKTKPTSEAVYIQSEEVTVRYTFPDKKTIEKGVKIGFSKTLKLELIRKFVDSDTDGIALLSLLSRLLDILAPLQFSPKTILEFRKFVENVNPFENKSLFRDAVKGRIYELVDLIKSEGNLIEAIKTAMNRDLDMNMILLTKEDSEKQVEILRARERETLKERLRQLTDTEREVTKMLLDIGIAQYIVTNEDRRLFAKELGVSEKIGDDDANADDVPEGGHTNRDYFEEDVQLNENGQAIEPDRGDYGDTRDRPADDYSRGANYDLED
jgi:hypothetical protein